MERCVVIVLYPIFALSPSVWLGSAAASQLPSQMAWHSLSLLRQFDQPSPWVPDATLHCSGTCSNSINSQASHPRSCVLLHASTIGIVKLCGGCGGGHVRWVPRIQWPNGFDIDSRTLSSPNKLLKSLCLPPILPLRQPPKSNSSSSMRLLTLHTPAGGTIALAIITIPYLTTSAPTNETSAATKILAVSPIRLAADQCPTPPTEFLPYPPPQGYVPGPGCPPASSGTQPSEGNPPAGFYGGSGSGSGSYSQSTSSALGLKGINPIARIMSLLLPHRTRKKAMTPHSAGSAVSVVNAEGMHWMFDGMRVFGGAVDDHRV